MTCIAQLDDRGAVVSWSPVGGEHADVIALGTKEKGSAGFDDYGGELELVDLNVTSGRGGDGPVSLGKVRTSTRFASLSWGRPGGGDGLSDDGAGMDGAGMGLLAGGLVDGTVEFWKASSLLDSDAASSSPSSSAGCVLPGRSGSGPALAVRFNPHPGSTSQLAAGFGDGEVSIVEAGRLDAAPTSYGPGGEGASSRQGGEITQVAWNSQVSHILASSSSDGTVAVWDLRQKKPWCELRAESNGASASDVAWNPTQGLHILTASADDRNPGLKLWDLRASTTMPLTTLEGHSGGVLSLAWCPHDDTLLLSCGKDNRTLLWDLYALQPIAEIPSADDSASPSPEGQGLYGGGLGSSQQKRYDVQWSPTRRGVVSTCSFDRKVQAHSVNGLATKCGRPPKWMSNAGGVSCGFGGTVVATSSASDATDGQGQPAGRCVTITTVEERPGLAQASERFEAESAGADPVSFCRSVAESRANGAGDEGSDHGDEDGGAYESQVWSFMQIMFEANAREELLHHLGFDPRVIADAATGFVEEAKGEEDDTSTGKADTPPMSAEAEATVKNALLVGNFEAAVECCFRSGNLADAVVLASCGGADLWAKTQAEYFAREASKRPFLTLVSAVVHDRLSDFVGGSDPTRWRETLAVLSTYGKSDEFPVLCAALGDRLEGDGDYANASLCYMCALSLGRAVRYWMHTLESADEAADGGGGGGDGGADLLPLQDFVEKVTIFTRTLDPGYELDDDIVATKFAEYAKALAEQGLLVTAAKYLRGDSQECQELRDRIYRSRMGQFCPDLHASPPEFPYGYKDVGVARDLYAITVKQSGGTGGHIQQHQQETSQVHATVAEVHQQSQQQPQQQQPQQQQQNVQHQEPQQQQQSNGTQSIPSGWVAMQDPSSGRTYYANQTTGESSWDFPADPSPQPAPVPAANYSAQPQPVVAGAASYSQEPQQQPTAGTTNGTSSASARSAKMKVANKYGDGFVTSSSHPQLAEQYGNTGTSNPYSTESRPGTATMVLGTGGQTKKAPVSGTLDRTNMPTLSEENQYLSDGLLAVVGALQSLTLSTTEKRQASESEKGVAVFLKNLARGNVDADVANKVGSMLSAMQNRDYTTASSIVTGLVSHEWKDHKDWLKGMKFLVQLATRKL